MDERYTAGRRTTRSKNNISTPTQELREAADLLLQRVCVLCSSPPLLRFRLRRLDHKWQPARCKRSGTSALQTASMAGMMAA